MRKRSKRYLNDAKKAVADPQNLQQAVKKIKSFASTKFDQSVNCAIHLGIDPKQADQAVRGAISLPNGIGQSRKVIAFCESGEADAAKQAGAVEAGADDLIKKINDGWMDFDVAIASPKMMGKVGKLGKVLGPQGKMPSPKNGTVTPDVLNAIKEFAAGKVEFRNDTGGNVHAVVGKMSFEEGKLAENITAFIDNIKRMKPSSMKGAYIKKVSLSGTMSPGVLLDLSTI